MISHQNVCGGEPAWNFLLLSTTTMTVATPTEREILYQI